MIKEDIQDEKEEEEGEEEEGNRGIEEKKDNQSKGVNFVGLGSVFLGTYSINVK